MTNLWSENTPEKFWRTTELIPPEFWKNAIKAALHLLMIPELTADVDVEKVLEMTLGEGQFGRDHWRLSRAKRLYYFIKPLLPRFLTRAMRQVYSGKTRNEFPLGWPVEERYVRFLEEILRQVIIQSGMDSIHILHFWPEDYRYALVLTHDIETSLGQAQVKQLAEMEADLGFRSSFNFIPERYPLDRVLMDWLRKHGFEIGVHGLKHDGKLFLDRKMFSQRAARINAYLKEFGAVGFRAPLTHRQPEWMQELEIKYDASFFDSDPFEPIPGGVMTIWPFMIGHFIELPYTLVQDFSLMNLLEEKTGRIWKEKTAYIREHRGMALINTHPDYLIQPGHGSIYESFLKELTVQRDCWKVLPHEMATWWITRSQAVRALDLPGGREVRVGCSPDTTELSFNN